MDADLWELSTKIMISLPLGVARGSERGKCQLLLGSESHHDRLGDLKGSVSSIFLMGKLRPREQNLCPRSYHDFSSIVSILSKKIFFEAAGKNQTGKMGRKLIFLECSLGPLCRRRASCSF